MRHCQHKQRGVSLIELMIALVIIGIISSVALPLYSTYQVRSYRSQAMTDLSNCAQAAERYYTVNFAYDSSNMGCVSQSPPSGTAVYDILVTVPASNTDTFTVRATPATNSRTSDDGYLEITETGARRWDKDNDGTIGSGEDNWRE